MVFKEFGGIRLFPFSEYVAFGRTYAVHDVDDAWYRVFALSASSSVRRKTVEVELALEDMGEPIGVADYQLIVSKKELEEVLTNEIKKFGEEILKN